MRTPNTNAINSHHGSSSAVLRGDHYPGRPWRRGRYRLLPPTCACGSQASQGARPTRRSPTPRPRTTLGHRGSRARGGRRSLRPRRDPSHPSILGRATSSVNPDDRLDGPIGRTISMLSSHNGACSSSRPPGGSSNSGMSRLRSSGESVSRRSPRLGAARILAASDGGSLSVRAAFPRRGDLEFDPLPLLERAAACAARSESASTVSLGSGFQRERRSRRREAGSRTLRRRRRGPRPEVEDAEREQGVLGDLDSGKTHHQSTSSTRVGRSGLRTPPGTCRAPAPHEQVSLSTAGQVAVETRNCKRGQDSPRSMASNARIA